MKRVTDLRIQVYAQANPSPLHLSIQDPSSESPYQVTLLDGLGADDIIWVGDEARLQTRVIVMQVSLNPNWSANQTYSSLRNDLFRIIHGAPGGRAYLYLYNREELLAITLGRIVKMEPNSFTKMPDVKITMECADGLLYGPGSTAPPVVEVLSSPARNQLTVTDLASTAPHGGTFQVKFHANMSSFSIEADHGGNFSCAHAFLTNDILRIDSLTNSRDLRLIRGTSINTSIADGIQQGSRWPTIYPGVTHFRCPVTVSWESVEYPSVYWGI